MPTLNKVLICGHLTRDVEMRFTPGGMALAKLGLALNRKFKDSKTNEMREEVTFVDVEVWGKQAESCNQFLSKGRAAFVEGRLKLDQWEDKQSGQKRSKLTVVADRVQFMGGGEGKAASGKPQVKAAAPGGPSDDEIPFDDEN